MKRFLLFGGVSYYATGGFYDLIGQFDDADEAAQVGERLHAPYKAEWWHVVDGETGLLVRKSPPNCEPYGYYKAESVNISREQMADEALLPADNRPPKQPPLHDED